VCGQDLPGRTPLNHGFPCKYRWTWTIIWMIRWNGPVKLRWNLEFWSTQFPNGWDRDLKRITVYYCSPKPPSDHFGVTKNYTRPLFHDLSGSSLSFDLNQCLGQSLEIVFIYWRSQVTNGCLYKGRERVWIPNSWKLDGSQRVGQFRFQSSHFSLGTWSLCVPTIKPPLNGPLYRCSTKPKFSCPYC
jgi:hypothetical protein